MRRVHKCMGQKMMGKLSLGRQIAGRVSLSSKVARLSHGCLSSIYSQLDSIDNKLNYRGQYHDIHYSNINVRKDLET
jgi:hypothetical protein